jgi:hypothetical protein
MVRGLGELKLNNHGISPLHDPRKIRSSSNSKLLGAMTSGRGGDSACETKRESREGDTEYRTRVPPSLMVAQHRANHI